VVSTCIHGRLTERGRAHLGAKCNQVQSRRAHLGAKCGALLLDRLQLA